MFSLLLAARSDSGQRSARLGTKERARRDGEYSAMALGPGGYPSGYPSAATSGLVPALDLRNVPATGVRGEPSSFKVSRCPLLFFLLE